MHSAPSPWYADPMPLRPHSHGVPEPSPGDLVMTLSTREAGIVLPGVIPARTGWLVQTLLPDGVQLLHLPGDLELLHPPGDRT